LLQLDETRLQVLGEPGRANTALSFMWVARGGPPEAPVILFHYAPSRGTEVAVRMLGDYEGYVQTDGYDVYDQACAGAKGVVHVGCLAHARRTFSDAHKNSKRAGSAEEALATIARVYRVERLREAYRDPLEFAAERRRQVEPILAEFHGWLQRRVSQVPPETLLGKAVAYTLRQWPKLIRYLDHPAIGPDTNAVENAIRPFVVGRKQWLFSGSPRGATASATLFSIIETARANGKESYWYLRKLFDELPAARTDADIQRLAPFRRADP
jgi:transposase